MQCIENRIFKQHIWTFCNLAQNSSSDVIPQLTTFRIYKFGYVARFENLDQFEK